MHHPLLQSRPTPFAVLGCVAAVLSLLGAATTLAEAQTLGPAGFCEGLGAVQVGDRWGFLDHSGELAIPPGFERAMDFRRGFAWVLLDGEARWIDRTGRLLDPGGPEAAAAAIEPGQPYQHFSEAEPGGDGLWGYRDARGEAVLPPTYGYTGRFSEGRALFSTAGERETQKSGYLGMSLREVIPARWYYGSPFSEGLAAVLGEGRYTFIDAAGERAFPGDFRSAFPFSEGLAAVDLSPEKNAGNSVRPGRWVFLNREGERGIDAEFEEARPFHGGLAAVRVGGSRCLIDATGAFRVEPIYLYIRPLDAAASAFRFVVVVGNRGRSGVVDRGGRVLIKPKYVAIGGFGEGLVATMLEERWGYTDLSGREVIAPRFSEAGAFREGLALVREGSSHGYIDRTGAWFWRVEATPPPQWEGL